MVMKAKACRCLFGSPNHDQIEQELKSRLKEMSLAESEKWNFDFGTDSPLGGRYDWEPLQSDETTYVPSFYTTERSAECNSKKFGRGRSLKRPHNSVVGVSYARLVEPETSGAARLDDATVTTVHTTNTVATLAPSAIFEPRVQTSQVRVPIPERALHNKSKRRKLGKSKSYVMKAASAKQMTQTTLPSLFRVIKNSGSTVTSTSVKSTLSTMR